MQNLPLDARTVLIGAAGLLAERGWCRGRMIDSNNRVCLRGAIEQYLLTNHKPLAAADLAEQRLAEILPAPANSWVDPLFARNDAVLIVSWNDYVCETETQAVEMLLRAAGVV